MSTRATFIPYPDEPAEVYLTLDTIQAETIRLPVTPHTISVSQSPKNESDSLFDGRPYTRPRLMNAQTMTMDFLLPYYEETTVCLGASWRSRVFFTDFFWQAQQRRLPIIVTIIYPNYEQTNGSMYAQKKRESYNGKWMLDKWDYTQTAEKGSDWEFSLSFTEYYPTGNIQTNRPLENPRVMTGERDYRRVSD